ncbi:MAG: hypothetical protein HC851_19120 [Acaryochloris sp. RU_4_1]|nr:hypothetical protein [Acaryochloris sp. RU_4_1]
MSNIYFRIKTQWPPNSERGFVVHAVRNHFGPGTSFTRLCTDIMFSVLRVLAVAIQTRNRAMIQQAIQISKVQIDGYYQMALGLAEFEVRMPVPIQPGLHHATGMLFAGTNDLEGKFLTEDSEDEFDLFEEILMDD